RSEISTKQPLFQLFAAIALLCLVGESLMIPRLNRGGTVP
ncbi:MAG: hypothetical protein RLZZ238_783, partial [Planctomycetota bacterium]